MRDILEDAHKHKNDGYGRAQAAEKKVLPKRFYKKVELVKVKNGFAIALDAKHIKTPSKKPVIIPNENLAQILLNEWQAQGEFIDAISMPFTRVINSALEGEEGIENALILEIVNYGANDLLLYRAQDPQELVLNQEKYWDSLLLKFSKKFGIKFISTIGIIHVEQPKASLEKLKSLLDGLDRFTLTSLTLITSLTGSGLIAIALLHNLISADEAWKTAHVDEDFNDKIWGQDEEAIKRRNKRKVDFDVAIKIIEILS